MKPRVPYREVIWDAIWLKRHMRPELLAKMDYEQWLNSHGWELKDFEFNRDLRRDLDAMRASRDARDFWDSISDDYDDFE